MNTLLNITNGDCAVSVMREAGIPGDIIPWRDVLHDGPVPGGLSLRELSAVRTGFISERGWGDPQAIAASFRERDAQLERFRDYTQVRLWFEHDLYDQLQLLQILDWFAEHPPGDTPLSLICTDQYLGVISPQETQALTAFEAPVNSAQLALAQRAWAAFRSPTPEAWRALLEDDTSALPFLHGAIERLLEEYPACDSGLSRTAYQALTIIAGGEQHPGRVFAEYQETEERRFLGDSSFWVILDAMLQSEPPLLALPEGSALSLPVTADQTLSVTAAGHEVLAGTRRWVAPQKPERWLGGVCLRPENSWCWDARNTSLVAPA